MNLVKDYPFIHLLAARAKMSREAFCDFRQAKESTAKIQVPLRFKVYLDVCEQYFASRYDINDAEKLYDILDPSRPASLLEEALIMDLASEFEERIIIIDPKESDIEL